MVTLEKYLHQNIPTRFTVSTRIAKATSFVTITGKWERLSTVANDRDSLQKSFPTKAQMHRLIQEIWFLKSICENL